MTKLLSSLKHLLLFHEPRVVQVFQHRSHQQHKGGFWKILGDPVTTADITDFPHSD